MSAFKMSDLAAKHTPGQICTTEVNYFWKRFDFRNDRSFNQVLEEHPYVKDPVASASKAASIA